MKRIIALSVCSFALVATAFADDKHAAAIYVANGYGRLAGLSQVQELGEAVESLPARP